MLTYRPRDGADRQTDNPKLSGESNFIGARGEGKES